MVITFTHFLHRPLRRALVKYVKYVISDAHSVAQQGRIVRPVQMAITWKTQDASLPEMDA
jgi:hypothetical protein